MEGKQFVVMSGKKVVYISDIFTTEEDRDIEFQKALEVYEEYTKKRSIPHILETVYGGCF
ncbi:MAG: hypothetical protein IKQ23_10960 [Treponema sp.]|nr:hypothetical protein [Treponema sp.]MBR7080972.1 hypothetical protein [Treponema sp.]